MARHTRAAARAACALTVLVVVTALAPPAIGAKGDLPPIIPVEDFYRNPDMASVFVSPDGEYISYLAPYEGRLNIHVRKIGSDETWHATAVSDRDITWYFWGGKSRIVYLRDAAGDENFKLYAVDPDGSNPKDLTPFPDVKVQPIDSLKEIDDEIIISMNKRDPSVFDVYRMNIVTGERKMIAENPGDVLMWMTDHDGALRVAVGTDGADMTVRYRRTENDPFEEIVRTDFRDKLMPQSFTFDNKKLYVATDIGRDKAALYTYDPEKKKVLDLLYEHPDVDVSDIVLSDVQKKLMGVFYYADRGQYVFFENDWGEMYHDIKALLPDRDLLFVSSDLKEEKWTIQTFDDRSKGEYYYYDKTSGDLTKLADMSPWLNRDHLAERRPISYTARDGLTIPGYLTLPIGLEPKNLPLVLYVHGGPWKRDMWGFDPTAQLLANRGYAVLQPNFRGSVGYGKAFWTASFKEWGRSMQDDLTDGVKWLIGEGIVDPDRVCIHGGSYGGYATLAGVTLTPELYSCAVNYCGVTDLITLIETFPPYWKNYRDMWCEMVGDPVEDAEMLKAVSPKYLYDNIRVPMMVVQGGNDVRVPKEISEEIVASLRERGIDVTYVFKENEGHGFLNEENQFEFYREMEKFLGKHLGGRVAESSG
jgi:dipeptidyl aminopeptidase/acylaminoacyl peptidase